MIKIFDSSNLFLLYLKKYTQNTNYLNINKPLLIIFKTFFFILLLFLYFLVKE